MADRALNLDDFLSRFQLLRPQPSRHALNQRQAAVLVPIVRRPQPGLLLTQRLDAELSLSALQEYREKFPAWRDADPFTIG